MPQAGVDGAYVVEERLYGTGSFRLEPQQSLTFSAVVSARRASEQPLVCDAAKELADRRALVEQWQHNLVLETPDSVLNRMFAFSKLRACESIYETKGGPMHGPGGESYYAAIWANDQAEYVNPFFPFEGYAYGNASSLNSYEWFARYMNDEWKPIPSSIIAEGTDIWNGAGDRGDAAMIAYGAARYVLARGDKEEALRLWPLITWCLEYCNKQLNDAGVVRSDRDELEGPLPLRRGQPLHLVALLRCPPLGRLPVPRPGRARHSGQDLCRSRPPICTKLSTSISHAPGGGVPHLSLL